MTDRVTLALATDDVALACREAEDAKRRRLTAAAHVELTHAVGTQSDGGRTLLTLPVGAAQDLAAWLERRASLYEQSSAAELRRRAASLRRVFNAIRVALPPLGTSTPLSHHRSGQDGLTQTERELLLMACWSHRAADCPGCNRVYTTAEVATDLWPRENCSCRTCGADLVPSIREHLLSCSAVTSLEAQEIRARSVNLQHESKGARKASEQARTRADQLARENEARRQRAEGRQA
jgi:hypothetical protein